MVQKSFLVNQGHLTSMLFFLVGILCIFQLQPLVHSTAPINLGFLSVSKLFLGTRPSSEDQLRQVHDFFQRSIQRRPAEWRAYAGLGFLSTKLGLLSEGAYYWQQAASLAPDNQLVSYHFGVALYRKGDRDGAAAALRKAKAEQKYTTEGDRWKKMGNLQAAQENYERAVQINPGWRTAQFSLGEILEGRALKAIESGDLHEAEAQLLKSIRLAPEYKKSHYLLGLVYYRQGRLVEAEGSLLEDLYWRPEHAWSYSLLGDVYRDEGRMQASMAAYLRAIPYFEALARDHPENSPALYQKLGRLYSRTGQWTKAVLANRLATQADRNAAGVDGLGEDGCGRPER